MATTQKPAATPAEAKPTAKKAVATKAAAAKKVAAAAVVKAPVVAKAAPEAVKAAAPAAVTTAKPTTKTAAKAPAKKVSAPKTKLKPSSAPAPVLTSEQRTHYVAVAAFYIAERRGFTLGNPAEDWLAAEAEVDRLIASGHFTG